MNGDWKRECPFALRHPGKHWLVCAKQRQPGKPLDKCICAHVAHCPSDMLWHNTEASERCPLKTDTGRHAMVYGVTGPADRGAAASQKKKGRRYESETGAV